MVERVCGESTDELLELIWMLKEEGRDGVEDIRAAFPNSDPDAVLSDAENEGLISVAEGRVSLKHSGSHRASEIIRRHRLAETLLTVILEMDEEQVESEACQFEHILSKEATESVCTLLGHPPACPHGKSIPRGACCGRFKRQMSPLVVPLSDLSPGERSRIVFIAPKSHARLDRLGALGIVAGSIIRLHQKSPACILKVEETDVALDPDIAAEIFVKRV